MSDEQIQQAAESVEAEPAATVSTSSKISDEAWNGATSTWIDRHVRNSPLSGATEAWNHLNSVLHRLREYLESELQNPGSR